jgi:hypothetical protein
MKVRSSVGWLWMVGAMFAMAGPATPGCATERAPINRVQPDYIRKSDVIPSQYAAILRAPPTLRDRSRPPTLSQEVIRAEAQWYHQITVLDKPATTGASGVTSYTQVERIYWEVTENLLIARQGYERLQDAQNAASTGQGTRQGEIVAAYTIDSHFDIRNDYNATTGEPLNVVVENTTDRPWFQREFMRVDWSRNLVGTFTPITRVAWGSMQAEAQAYINTPDDPNRPVFDYGTLNGQANALTYFDVTNRMILHPETVRIEGAGSVPACLLYDRITESCEPADVLMRVSFRRVDPSRDYAPMALDGHRMERFGFFEDARNGFNARTGTPGQVERRHYANRHNLWQQHHVSAPAGALDHKAGDPACASDLECLGVSPTAKCDLAPGPNRGRCGEVYVRCAPSSRAGDEASRAREADALCEALPGMGAGSGAHCDLDVASTRGDRLGLCLLPYRQRTVRPIAYHLSPNYPARIMPVTDTIMGEWRRVFNHAVREARYRECVIDPRGGGAASCERWRSDTAAETRDARAVWTACHNPVWGTDAAKPGAHTQAEVDAARAAGWDNEACGPQGTSARLGDTRYSMLASVNEYDAQGPWGLAMITGDPTTGEVLSGRGSVWLTVTDAQAAFATDMIRILNREITPERFALGQTIFDAYDYVRSLGGRDVRTGSSVPYTPRPVHRDYESADEIRTVLNQTTLAHMRTVAPEDQPRLEASQIRALATDATSGEVNDQYLLRSLTSQYAAELPHTSTEDATARMARMQGTPIESMVVDREMLLGQEINPDLRTQEAVAAASPFRNNSMAFRQAREQWQRAMQTHECRADAAFSDDVISVLMHRFRSNVVPEDVRFGRTWNFHAQGAPATCPDAVEVDGEGRSNCPLDYDVIQQYLVQYIHYGVTLHEIGHSVGERHNFSGSADPWNYDDRYWPLRRSAGARPGDALPNATAILPRWEHQARGLPFYSTVEEKGGVEEYAYSSVMDYVGWNQDAHGLGRYDRAFVMHGYVDMVEAFDQVADPEAMLNAHEVWAGGYQSAFRPLYGGTQDAPTVLTHHYTEIPALVGVDAQGNPRLGDANRYPVFLRETRRQGYGAFQFTPDHTNMTDYGRDGQRGADPHVLVPYSFGTDDWANNIWNSQRYDAGPDMYESMRYVAQHYQDYYFANAFARNRATFTRNGYRARMTSRYLDQMYYSMRNFVYLLSIYQNFYGGQAAFAPLFDPNSTSPAARTMNAGRLGSALVTDTLANSILMPQSSAVNENGGVHCVRNRGDGTSIYERVNGNSCINIPVGAGREFASQYDFSAGFFWRDRLLSVGSYHDKQLGLEYLTSTFQWVPGRYIIEFGDVHQLQINFYTLYPGATLRFFGSVLSRDYDDVGVQARPRVDSAEPELFRTQYARLNLPFGSGPNSSGRDHGVSARAINPNLGFTLELDALAYLRGQLELTFDRTARVSAMLWHENDHWALADNATRDLVTFTNPYTGVAYHAVHISGAAGTPGAIVGVSRRDSAVDETGIAARMLQQANRLSAQRDRTPAAQRANIDNELHGYIDLLDALRDVSHLYN